MPSGARLVITLCHDVVMLAVSFFAALYLRLGDDLLLLPGETVIHGLVILVVVGTLVLVWMQVHRIVWRYVSIGDLGRIVRAVLLIVLVFVVCQFIYNRLDALPRSFLVIEILVLTGLLATPRLLYRLIRDREIRTLFERDVGDRVPVLLVGAGDGSDLFIREMSRGHEAPYRVVGIVDDRGDRVGRRIRGIPVLGGLDTLAGVAGSLQQSGAAPRKLVITRQDMDGATVRSIVSAAEPLGLEVSRLPRLTALDRAGQGQEALAPRPIDVEDVLGRTQAVFETTPVRDLIAGRRILITGAGGSIGGELARQAVSWSPRAVALFDCSEYLLYRIDRELAELAPDVERQSLIGDVRDPDRIAEVVGEFRPDILLHAAALKHVPLVEANPLEAIMTNVIGTRNVAAAARDAGVRTMVLISTDKAVNPGNVMGATKRLAESWCQALDRAGAQEGGTRFATVRFGNVLGSTGSVIPLFESQIAAGGPVTVTHPEMTRYFMTLREAVSLVLRAAAFTDGNSTNAAGGIFVLDMGEPVRILDLARQMIRLSGYAPDTGIEIVFIGPRPGEKLHEALLHDDETLVPTEVPAIRMALSRSADPGELAAALAELERRAAARESDAALACLGACVPEFSADGPASDAGGHSSSAHLRTHG